MLKAGSNATDKGVNIIPSLPADVFIKFPDFDFSVSINGISRPQGPAWDIGAYEYTSGTACIHKSEIPPCDGCVGGSELSAFLSRWYISSTDVTMGELMEAIGYWKRGC